MPPYNFTDEMRDMEALLRMLDWRMGRPELYGWYHLCWLVIPFIAAWLLCRGYRRSKDPQGHIRKVVFGTAVLVGILEFLHQVNYNLIWQDGRVQIAMQWYAFPYQFCTTPLYVGLLTGVFKKG